MSMDRPVPQSTSPCRIGECEKCPGYLVHWGGGKATKFPCLHPCHPYQMGLRVDRPTRNEVLMEIADVIAQRSTCTRKQVGAVVARDGRVLVLGYNGAPSGMPHCLHEPNVIDAPCTIAVHAEANAIAFAAKHGIRLEGATLYTTCSPCHTCAQITINSGIVEVYYLEQYRDTEPIQLLEKAGLKVWQLSR